MSISQLARSIADSPTLRLNEQARLLRDRGLPIIHLGIGEPKNKTPITAILAAANKLNSGDVKYTPTDGTPGLKKAIIKYTEENYDRVVDPENIIVTNGAKQSLFNVLFSLVDPQDEVIIPAPYWVSYPEMVKMAYGIPIIVTPKNGGFYPRMEDILEAVTSYTKAIIINSPNNPSGMIYPPDFIQEIVEYCESKGIYLILDDIYHRLVFDGLNAVPGYQFTDHDIESTKVIVTNGVSKVYGMTGFRIGWVIANRRLVEVMTNVQAQMTSSPATILQSAAEGALNGIQSYVESLRLTIENNRNVVMQELRSFNGIRINKPQGTFYCLPDFRAYQEDSVKLADYLLKKALVVTVPGVEFGIEGHLRISYSGTVKEITEGFARMKWALDPESPREIYIGDRKMIRDWL
ncbi:MAG: pyridoxal phosphate-dependent aminotransferase [Anaerolineales bacterium]|jgi:aspartate aminotransferase